MLQFNRVHITIVIKKPRNARTLDDLIQKANSEALYAFVRDGHTSDLSELVTELDRLLPNDPHFQALRRLTWMMLKARDLRGSDAVLTCPRSFIQA